MKYLIDAFNVIYKFDDLEDFMYAKKLKEARQGLLQKLQQSNQKRKKALEYLVFVDGKKEPGSEVRSEIVGDLEMFYSHDLSADYLIRTFIEKSPRPREFTVVSTDKAVREHAKRSRCKSMLAEDFAREILALLAGDPHNPGTEKAADVKLEQSELDYWTRLFDTTR